MNIPPGALAKALQDLDRSMRNSLDGTKIENIKNTIGDYAIAAAVASGVAGGSSRLCRSGSSIDTSRFCMGYLCADKQDS